MIQKTFFIGILVCSLILVSCDETVSPKTVFVEKPILYAVLVGSSQYPTNSHDVILSKLYNDEDRNRYGNSINISNNLVPYRFELYPYQKATDPIFSGASVILQGRTGMDTLFERKTKHGTYSGNSFPLLQNDSVTVTAHLPNGEILKAATVIPLYRAIEMFPPYSAGVTTLVNRFTNGDAWILEWSGNLTEEHLFAPRLTLNYSKLVNDREVLGSVRVPVKYVQAPQGRTPVYPSITYETSMSFDFNAMDSTMAQISAGDPDKRSYKAINFTLSLTEYDVHASRYYSSINGSLDEFSIRLDETTYSNVNGGVGVFGSCVQNEHYYEIDPRYARLFGYRSVQ